jgi:hypothetical protein
MTAQESYQLYLKMPSGLAKIRYESEAYKWCAGSINQLRLMGIVKIKSIKIKSIKY